ncbi:MAG: type II secretion system protein GspN [Myxococcales bacterium]|nr:type II secretion system protein GspN [Myxococcales bacterium]
MVAAAPTLPDRGRSRRIAGVVVAGLLLTAFFMVLRFPYDHLSDVLAGRIERATGLRVTIGDLGLQLQLFGPGLGARDVRVARPDGTVFAFERVVVRPGWSISWLRGDPAFFVTLRSDMGDAAGTLTLASPTRCSGELFDVDLSRLPVAALNPGAALAGRADATLDVALGESGPDGTLDLVARDGSLEHPMLPLAVPFEELSLQLRLGGEQRAEILASELRSPLVTGSLTGTLGHAASLEASALRLEGSFTLSSNIRGALNAQGVEIGTGGAVKFVVMGTLARPIVR